MQDFYINLVEYLYENLEKALDKIFLEEKKEKQNINFFNIFCCYKQNFFEIEN